MFPRSWASSRSSKQQGRIRYIGVTTTFDQQYSEIVDIMKREPLDFIGVDYAIDARQVEDTILPVAQERKIAVMVYQPFGRTRLWNRVGSQPVPDYAKEFDATTWAQFFIKFVASHPAVTVVTPATSQAKNMTDNLGGGRGRLPDAAMRKRMIATIDALPAARPISRLLQRRAPAPSPEIGAGRSRTIRPDQARYPLADPSHLRSRWVTCFCSRLR